MNVVNVDVVGDLAVRMIIVMCFLFADDPCVKNNLFLLAQGITSPFWVTTRPQPTRPRTDRTDRLVDLHIDLGHGQVVVELPSVTEATSGELSSQTTLQFKTILAKIPCSCIK